ncbi:toxin-antitoxin system YwqK family antitoxin [Flavobacterium sp. NKUCC04_CG]|uniref:toxin-antitoxin system YwqK family antitoxin n=1 Tax=Flavobacterium sp. NKUCC04_CG TaxID=2842121 RepID=UPI001C5AAB26|nr:toxin-antitoxin system YwqK family antitoxin [Flavobacterium sp. NKUCC04_CG]MBW3520062.1 toxin-antitoxin system YwqK family antitoxin [Flavobacterium sp. NKUCC04_CG]
MTPSFKTISLFLGAVFFQSSYGQHLSTASNDSSTDINIQTEVGEVIDGKQNGLWCLYEDHILQRESHYVNGLANGLWIWYYPNGSIETVATYQMGYKKGPQISYFESGKRQSEGNYEGEDRDGIWCDYTATDPSYTQSTYKKGQLHGNYKKYDKNGTLREYGDFKDNKKTGNWTSFDVRGKLVESETFK